MPMIVCRRFRRIAVIGLLAVSTMAGPAFAEQALGGATLGGPQWVSNSICERLNETAMPGVDLEDRAAVIAFYNERGCRPVWLVQGGLTRAAALAVGEIGEAGAWGLDDDDFRLTRLKAVEALGADAPFAAIADAELEITGAILRYARYARGGRIVSPATQLSSYLDRQPELPDPAAVLAAIAVAPEPDAVLRSYQPTSEQFLRLKALLKEARASRKEAEVLTVPLGGPLLKEGDRHADVALIKKRLSVASVAGEEDLFTEPLKAAVKKLQAAAGLSADGMVGAKTRKAFVVAKPRGTDTIIANMEAWRWMPSDLGDRHIFINVPSFSIALYNHGVEEFNERVIVGEKETQTPIFSMAMQTIVLRPEWYLPDSIKLKKLLGGRSLESQGYVIRKNGRKIDSSRVNWAKANLSAYSVSQPSGSDNALGDVKFLFPNKHAVYLHDTPTKSLFNADVRTFSHGCVRVRNPLALAQVLLDEDKGNGAFNVDKLVRKGPHQNDIALDTPLPVHIGYFTVWVGEDGKPVYFDDTYGHERRITLALAKQWAKIDVGKDHLAAVDTSKLKDVAAAQQRRRMAAPMGVTRTQVFGGGYSKYPRRSGSAVSDMINRAIGF